MLDIYSMRQIYWANQDKGNWELSCWKAKVLLSIPQSSSCWIRRARQKVELADETIAKLLQCLRWSCFWGLWTYLGGYLWLCREHKWLRLWNCDRSREIQDPYLCLNLDKLDLLLGMNQVKFWHSWLEMFCRHFFWNVQNVDWWDISRPVLEKKGSMFSISRKVNLIPI